MSAAEILTELPTDTTTIAEAAELYVRAGLCPIPIYGIRADGTCACGRSDCRGRNRGKHPIGERWEQRATNDLDDVRDRFRGHLGNIGIYLAKGGLVLLDADGAIGLETARTWELPETLTQQSGSGEGAHFIYRFAPHQDPSQVTDRNKIAPGLDVKVRGQFVAAPSRHGSGGQYRWTNAVAPATLPDWLFERIRTPAPPAPAFRPAPSEPSAPDTLERRAAAYIAKIPPAIAGSGGHAQTFAAGRALAGWVAKGLPESVAFRMLQEYNARCEPPWSEKELMHKWNDAQKARKVPEIADRPPRRAIAGGLAYTRTTANSFADGGEPPNEPPMPPGSGGGGAEPDWRQELLYTSARNGKPKLVSHVENVIRILQLSPEWRGCIGFDDFRSRITVTGCPWDAYQKPTHDLGYWTDEDATRMCAWMRRKFHGEAFSPTITDCERAVAVVAHTHVFHPLRDYLQSVPWDEQSRNGTWLATYLGAEQSEYTELVGRWWLISAVARVFRPGCKVDTVPILEGPQGLRKSSALKVLAGPEYFSDTPIDIGSKDAYSAIQGCWFNELAELDSLMRAGPNKSKSFFSSSKDRFRKAYARHERDELRQCIFVGTTNLDEYLTDPTGARRFWPIRCTKIDLEALERDRDQLWAEAVRDFEEGRLWYPETDAEKAILGAPQAERTQQDALEYPIATWVERRSLEGRPFTMGDVLAGALGLEEKDWTKPTQTRVGILLMTRLRCLKRRISSPDGRRPWVYEPPPKKVGQQVVRQI